MYQFFIEDENAAEDFVTIEGSDVNHIKNVLRMKLRERKSACAPEVDKTIFVVYLILQKALCVRIFWKKKRKAQNCHAGFICFRGFRKNDKMEWIIQKTVELGVYEVIPVAMKNCVVKLDDKKAKSKVTRWQAIAESAAKQSKRSLIPEVKMPMSYKEAVAYAKELDVKLVPYENEHGMAGTKAAMEQIKKGESIAVFIGPEGGFAPEEIALVQDEMQLISLGRRILRTETAGIAALAILGYQLESSDMIE